MAVVLASGLFDQVMRPMDRADTDVQYPGKCTGHNVQCTMCTVEGEMQMCSAGAGVHFIYGCSMHIGYCVVTYVLYPG